MARVITAIDLDANVTIVTGDHIEFDSNSLVQISIARSLKRIADALEHPKKLDRDDAKERAIRLTRHLESAGELNGNDHAYVAHEIMQELLR